MLVFNGRIKSSRRISPGCTGGIRLLFFGMITSVVVDDFYVKSISLPPHETDPELIVDSDTVLASPISL